MRRNSKIWRCLGSMTHRPATKVIQSGCLAHQHEPVVIARSGSDAAIPRSGMNRIAAHALGLDPRVAIAPRNDSWSNDSWGNDSWSNDSWSNDSWSNDSWGNDSWSNDSWGNDNKRFVRCQA
jgi:hypothetical protein